MNAKKRNTLIAAAAAASLALAGVSFAHSGPGSTPSGPGGGPAWGGHMMGSRGGHMMRGYHGSFGRRGARPMISLALRFQEELKLSEAQIKKLTDMRDDFIRRAIGERAAVRTMRFDLRKALGADKVDLASVEKQIRAISKKRADRRIDRIRIIEKGKAVLTEEQLKTLQDLIRQRRTAVWGGGPGSMRPGGGPGSMGPGGGPGQMTPGQGSRRF